MANGEFIGLNTAGASKIVSAIDAYAKKINSVSFYASATETQVFAKGSSSYNAMMTMIKNADTQMSNLVTNKLQPLKTRIEALNTQYKTNDESQATTMNTRAKSILKS